MIVNSTPKGWEIIFQRHHALLATKIAAVLKPEFHTPNWIETLIAIAEHDDGQRNWQNGKFVDDEGHPIDFTAFDYDLEHAQKVVTEASYKSKWITLLVSKHITEIYSNASKHSDDVVQYRSNQLLKQKNLLKYFNLTPHQLQEYYSVLRWCEECSLAICRGSEESNLGQLSGKAPDYIFKGSHDNYHLDPWPFKENCIHVEVERYVLHQKKFKDNNELLENLKKTGPSEKKIIITPS